MRMTKWLTKLFLACVAGSVCSCATMGGGGGMHYLVDTPDATVVRG
jgi:hypothetical protein